MNLDSLLLFFTGFIFFSFFSFILNKVKGQVKKRSEFLYLLFKRSIFLISFIFAVLIVRLVGRAIVYWDLIILWGLFNFMVSYIKMGKAKRIFFYFIFIFAVCFAWGLRFSVAQNSFFHRLLPTLISTIFFLFMIYFFSFLAVLSGFVNGIFFIIALSMYIGVKFFIGVDSEELNLISFILGISFAVFVFEIIKPHFKIESSEGKFLGFLIALFSISSNTKMIFFETLIIPLLMLFFLISGYFVVVLKSFREKLLRKKVDHIVQYSRYDVFVFVNIVLLSVSLIAIFLKWYGLHPAITIIVSITFLIFEFILFLNFLKGRKIPIKTDFGSINILGVRVDNVDFQEALSKIRNSLIYRQKGYMITLNPVMVMNALEDKKIRDIFNASYLVVPDGIGVVLASAFLGTPLKERVAGVDLIESIFNDPPMEKMRVLMFGAEKGIAKRIGIELVKRFNIDITILDGFSKHGKDREELALSVENDNYDLILVGLGSPAQEEWIRKVYNNPKVKRGVFIGIGGSFDVISGKKKRAPEKWRKQGFEWVYRIMKEPFKRFNQLFQLYNFVLKIMTERFEEF